MFSNTKMVQKITKQWIGTVCLGPPWELEASLVEYCRRFVSLQSARWNVEHGSCRQGPVWVRNLGCARKWSTPTMFTLFNAVILTVSGITLLLTSQFVRVNETRLIRHDSSQFRHFRICMPPFSPIDTLSLGSYECNVSVGKISCIIGVYVYRLDLDIFGYSCRLPSYYLIGIIWHSNSVTSSTWL
jgi:hypothetical protein